MVFILNEFFAATGSAIHTQGGWIDKYLGDGLLAVFGQTHGVEVGCRQALRAARAIDLALDHVNAKLGAEIGRPLEVGMGIHAGPLLLGRIGYRRGGRPDGGRQRGQRREPAGSAVEGQGLADRDVGEVALHAGGLRERGRGHELSVPRAGRFGDAPARCRTGFAACGRDLPASDSSIADEAGRAPTVNLSA